MEALPVSSTETGPRIQGPGGCEQRAKTGVLSSRSPLDASSRSFGIRTPTATTLVRFKLSVRGARGRTDRPPCAEASRATGVLRRTKGKSRASRAGSPAQLHIRDLGRAILSVALRGTGEQRLFHPYCYYAPKARPWWPPARTYPIPDSGEGTLSSWTRTSVSSSPGPEDGLSRVPPHTEYAVIWARYTFKHPRNQEPFAHRMPLSKTSSLVVPNPLSLFRSGKATLQLPFTVEESWDRLRERVTCRDLHGTEMRRNKGAGR
ncbi:hypothetical protein VUR80DRAFT_9709 [Thermomyces stellatus]